MEGPNLALPETTIELKPCGICGRTFRQDTLERHQKICKKSSQKKRRTFDSKKQRAASDEVNEGGKNLAQSSSSSQSQKPKEKRKSNWREKHEDLIRTIRKSRESDNNNNTTQDEPKRRVPSDYVQCPGCERHFNQRAAERHIPWCQQKKQQTSKTPVAKDAKEKLFARVKYRVPLPGKVKKAATKPKTASSVNNRENKQHPEKREKESYSSPPTFAENRNTTNTSRTQNATGKRESRNESRSRESKSSTPDESSRHIKFKERFPNHNSKRGVDLEESFTADQLQELLSCSRLIDNRCPKTVPGVRLSGSRAKNNWTSELNVSSLDDSTLPEVSSSELPDTWMRKLGWSRDLEMSISSSGSSSSSSSGSLPPMSRESPSDAHLLFYCHQCHHKFPLIGAKYCCECGARRRGIGTINQTV